MYECAGKSPAFFILKIFFIFVGRVKNNFIFVIPKT